MASGRANGTLTIALDAMGGDHAPQSTVEGAVLATQEHRDSLEVILVGDPPAIRAELARYDVHDLPLRIWPAAEAIADGGHAALALHRRPSASVAVATKLVRDGEAAAVVAVGHTGACLIAASWYLGTMHGIDRPAAGLIFPLATDSFVIDLGTNPDAKPRQLVQFAVLGTVFARLMMKVSNPSVALLSNGSEQGKGNRQVREAYDLLARSGLNFIGNVEGHDIPAGKANVIVCDGFIGNILVKFMEGLSSALLRRMDALVGNSADGGLDRFRGELTDLTDATMAASDVLFLGVNGVFVPGHGRAGGPAIKRAIESAQVAVQRNVVDKMREELATVQQSLGGGDA